MKKYLFLLSFILITLISCQSINKDALTIDEHNRITNLLKDSINEAILETESSLSNNMEILKAVPSYDRWRKELPSFKELEAAYLNSINQVVRTALLDISDILFSYIKEYEFEDPKLFLDKSYQSISELLRRQCNEEVIEAFNYAVVKNKQLINESYNNLEKEAFIWKSNLDNLSLVGINNDISMIEPINDYDIATLAKELYFNALGQNEVKIRTRQEAEQK